MEIDRTVVITITKEEIEKMLDGGTVEGKGFELSLEWYQRYKWKLVEQTFNNNK